MLADAHISSLGQLWFDTWLFKDQAYKSIVRPTLEYGCTVWDSYRAYQKSWLERVQRRAARFVTRTYTKEEGCVTKALKQLNWPTLENRRQVVGLTLMYKCVTNHGPLLISPAMYNISLPQKPEHLIHWNLFHFSHPVSWVLASHAGVFRELVFHPSLSGYLGARGFSCAETGFGQVFEKSDPRSPSHARKNLWYPG